MIAQSLVHNPSETRLLHSGTLFPPIVLIMMSEGIISVHVFLLRGDARPAVCLSRRFLA